MAMSFESALSDTRESVSEPFETDPEKDQGERSAIDSQCFDQCATQLTRYSMSIVRQWADAEEITQEAFCRIIERNDPGMNSAPSQVRAVLFRTVRNLSIDRIRSRARHPTSAIDAGQIDDTRRQSDRRLEKLEAGIDALMEELPTKWKEALQLKINGELGYAEIALVMSATKDQVRTWIFRARKRLQTELRNSGLLEG